MSCGLSVALALSCGDQRDGLIGIHIEVVQPPMSVAQGFGEDRTRPTRIGRIKSAELTFARNDLAALVRRGRYPGNGECLNLPIDGNGLAEPDLDFLVADFIRSIAASTFS